MNLFPTLLAVGGLIAGCLDDRPELLLLTRNDRLPGESDLDYLKRELARIDGLMLRSRVVVARLAAENARDREQWEVMMRQNLEKGLEKRRVEADALKALGGGPADHPKASFTSPLPTVDDLLEAEKRELQQSVEDQLKEDPDGALRRARRAVADEQRRAKERQERHQKK